MSSVDSDKRAYPEPPRLTPVVEKQTALPNPALILMEVFRYAVDLPVTTFRELVDGVRAKNRPVYYHRKYRRVPDITECQYGDYVCYFEADMQFRRDFKVDQEIVKIIRDRQGACGQREGPNFEQNCREEIKLYREVAANFQSRYQDIGVYANARKVLSKQKERMMEAQAKSP